MAGLAVLAKEKGFKVTGCDSSVFPPMSDQLNKYDINLIHGFDEDQFKLNPDCWVIGNVATRQMPIIEILLDNKVPLMSGPDFLSKYFLLERPVIAVAGTHGKTTVSSILSWMFEYSGINVGFLIGGVPKNFNNSARIGDEDSPFIIEADEYDTAFFDKRSKFLHYKADIAIFNNLEFDHADIFSNINEIEKQFHHWIKSLSRNSRLIVNKNSNSLDKVLKKGYWSKLDFFNTASGWNFKKMESNEEQASSLNKNEKFQIFHYEKKITEIETPLFGEHNISNILAAFIAAYSLSLDVKKISKSVKHFLNVKRRMELRAEINGIRIIDDFAHHPTAIRETISAIKQKYFKKETNSGNRKIKKNNSRLIVVVEPRSNTMKLGVMQKELSDSLIGSDLVYGYAKGIKWDFSKVLSNLNCLQKIHYEITDLVDDITNTAKKEDTILIMSNGSFDNLHEKLIKKLKTK